MLIYVYYCLFNVDTCQVKINIVSEFNIFAKVKDPAKRKINVLFLKVAFCKQTVICNCLWYLKIASFCYDEQVFEEMFLDIFPYNIFSSRQEFCKDVGDFSKLFNGRFTMTIEIVLRILTPYFENSRRIIISLY